jgi:DNA-directed RNA polymerase subunit RPC12/RpoP
MEKNEVDTKEIVRQNVMMVVTLRRFNQWQFRLWIASLLARLAAWIAWMGIEFEGIEETEPWLYYCPRCGKDIAGRKPFKPMTMWVGCPHCNFQSLVVGDIDEPYLLDPKAIEDDTVLCIHGCHYHEPYGFVPMGGCPIHD